MASGLRRSQERPPWLDRGHPAWRRRGRATVSAGMLRNRNLCDRRRRRCALAAALRAVRRSASLRVV